MTSTNTNVYRRGFLLTQNTLNVNHLLKNNWLQVQVGHFSLFYDPDNPCHVIHKNQYWVCQLGTIMETISYTLNSSQIAETILEYISTSGDCRNNENLWDYLDCLNGRFLIIWGNTQTGEFYLVNDATASRSVWYDKNQLLVASHYQLVQDFALEAPSPYFDLYLQYKKKNKQLGKMQPWCAPGDTSPYQNIHLLLCNHCLQLNTQSTFRFWPRHNMPEINIATATDYIADTIQKEAEALTKHYDVLLSTTVGNDSRISLSAFSNVRDQITLFTYYDHDTISPNASSASADRTQSLLWAKRISNQFGLNFIPLDTKASDITEDLQEALCINHYHQHYASAVPSLMQIAHQKKRPLHLRSNLIEIIRNCYFSLDNYNKNKDLLAKSLTEWSMYHNHHDLYSEVLRYYDHLVTEHENDSVYNYDIGILFYMEYRMSQWLSSILIETDPAFDTFMLFNQRNLLNYGMSIPKQYKDISIFTRTLIAKLWPSLISERYPNVLTSNYQLVDWSLISTPEIFKFLPDANGQYPYTLISGNTFSSDRSVYFLAEPHFEGISFGFSNNTIKKGDFVTLALTHSTEKLRPYYYEFNLLTPASAPIPSSKIRIEILINKKRVYSCSTNAYCTQINQIVHRFISHRKTINTIQIRLIAKEDCTFNFNGLLDIRSIILKKDTNFPYSVIFPLVKTISKSLPSRSHS